MNKLLLIFAIYFDALASTRGTSMKFAIDNILRNRPYLFDRLVLKNYRQAKIPCERWRDESSKILMIDCSGKKLTRAPELLDVDGIVELDLSRNQLREIPDMTAKGYSSVRCVNLAENRIERIAENAFSSKLEALYLHHNNITSMDEKFMEKISKNFTFDQTLTLHGNPLSCDLITRLASGKHRGWFTTCGKEDMKPGINRTCVKKVNYGRSGGTALRSSLFILFGGIMSVTLYLLWVDCFSKSYALDEERHVLIE